MNHNHLMRRCGRKPRDKNVKVPHLDQIIRMTGIAIPAAPDEVDRTTLVGTNQFGMLCNGYDSANPNAPVVGDCTIAAINHGKQIANLLAGKPWFKPALTDVITQYSACSGYVIGQDATDVGCVEQDVLKYAQTTGIRGPSGQLEKLLDWIEIDPKNVDHMQHGIDVCGFVYNGMDLPTLVMNQTLPFFDAPPKSAIDGGHCTLNWGYRINGLYQTISWGDGNLWMTPSFIADYVEEAYILIDPDLIEATGKTPLGLSFDQLQQILATYRE